MNFKPGDRVKDNFYGKGTIIAITPPQPVTGEPTALIDWDTSSQRISSLHFCKKIRKET